MAIGKQAGRLSISIGIRLPWLLAMVLACAPDASDAPATPFSGDAAIIDGTAVAGNAGGVVAVWTNPALDGIIECSGVMLNPNWLLTARHCVTPEHGGSVTVVAYAQPDSLQDYQSYTTYWPRTLNSSEVYRHPTEDAALVHFRTQSGYTLSYSNPLYAGSSQDLVGQTLDCYGYGNAHVGESGEMRLRAARMTVAAVGRSPCGVLQICDDKTNGYYFPANALGQVQWYGDSGGPCFLSTATGGRLITGIANKSLHENYEVVTGHWQAGTDWFREWIYSTTGTVPGPQCVFSGVTVTPARDRVTVKWHTSLSSMTHGQISADGSVWTAGGPPGTLTFFEFVKWAIATRVNHEYVFSALNPNTNYQFNLKCAGVWTSTSNVLAPAPPTVYGGTVRTLP